MRRSAKVESAAIREILHHDWNPIGCGVPKDEYDSCLWPVYSLLIRNAPREEVRTYLRWAADVNIAVPVSETKLSDVVDKLMALGFGKETPRA